LSEKISLLAKSFSFKNILDSVVFENINDSRFKKSLTLLENIKSLNTECGRLKGIKLTSFREDLKTYINGEGNKFVENTIRLVTNIAVIFMITILN